MTPIFSLDKTAATSKMNDVDGYVKGKVFPLAVETSSSFTAYAAKLNEAKTTAAAALTDTTKQDPQLRAALVYAAAMHRDSMYALAGRRRVLTLGINNMYREAYQVGKTAVDANNNKLPG